jgi:hypothetical protein
MIFISLPILILKEGQLNFIARSIVRMTLKIRRERKKGA